MPFTLISSDEEENGMNEDDDNKFAYIEQNALNMIGEASINKEDTNCFFKRSISKLFNGMDEKFASRIQSIGCSKKATFILMKESPGSEIVEEVKG